MGRLRTMCVRFYLRPVRSSPWTLFAVPAPALPIEPGSALNRARRAPARRAAKRTAAAQNPTETVNPFGPQGILTESNGLIHLGSLGHRPIRPDLKSRLASMISLSVFMTKGPRAAMGSFS